jgi:hypothetical protein
LFMNLRVISRASGGSVAENTPTCGCSSNHSKHRLSKHAGWALFNCKQQQLQTRRAYLINFMQHSTSCCTYNDIPKP